VHLGDADALGDLALHQVIDEAQPQDLALAVGQLLGDLLDPQRVLDPVELAVGPAVRTTTIRPGGRG
jgi:hypothetical protein